MRFARASAFAPIPLLGALAAPLGCGGDDAPHTATGAGGSSTSTTASTSTSTSSAGGGAGGATTSSSIATGGAGGGSTTTTGCDAPAVDCAGACVDLGADAAHCGACDVACGGGEACCAGSCSSDCATSITTVSPPGGPLSGGTWITLKGKGFSKGARVLLGASRAPAQVVDAETLIALAPPGLAADVDVRVDQGGVHATRAKAFRYAAYGVKGTWKKVDMSSPRGNWPGISVLQDGRVLITGGVANSDGASVESTADLFDPATQKVTPTASAMSAPRWTQAQITLLGGQVLVLGTWYGGASPPNGPIADLFDPATTAFAPTAGKPATEHRWPHAVTLADGRVLVVDGAAGFLDLYDPGPSTFSLSPIQTDLTGYRPARLLDGRVLLVRGAKSPSYFFDPETGTIALAGQGPTAVNGDVHTLPDGRVLYVAGSIVGGGVQTPTDTLEIFDPANPGFQPAPYHLAAPRQQTLTTAMLGDGTVLVLGGEVGNQVANPSCGANTFVLTDGVERIDPIAGKVTAFDSLPERNFVMSATTMLDGSIVAAGGAPCGGGAAYPYFYFLEGHR